MIKIDIKDRKIIYQLDLNSRQPYSQIGKKVGLPKNVVVNRINRLKEIGIIKNFYTVIDVYKLGYIIIRIHYKYQYTTPEIEKEIIDNFTNHKNSTLVASTQGMFNLKVVQIIKDTNDFYNLWQETQKKYGQYFENKSSALFINEIYYAPSYLILNDFSEDKREKISLRAKGNKVEIDEIDNLILKMISSNARLRTTDISNKLLISTNNVQKRLSNLRKIGVIRGFRTDINVSKLGYHIFRGNFFLKDYTQRDKIINHIKNNPYLVFIDTYTGDVDLEIEFHLESMSQLYQIMQDLMEKFPDAISHYKHLNIIEYHKFLYMPEI